MSTMEERGQKNAWQKNEAMPAEHTAVLASFCPPFFCPASPCPLFFCQSGRPLTAMEERAPDHFSASDTAFEFLAQTHAEFLECALLQLAVPLAGESEGEADIIEGLRLVAIQAKAPAQDLLFTGVQQAERIAQSAMDVVFIQLIGSQQGPFIGDGFGDRQAGAVGAGHIFERERRQDGLAQASHLIEWFAGLV